MTKILLVTRKTQLLRHQHMAEIQTFQIKVVPHTRFIQNVLKVAELVSHASVKQKFILNQSAASGDNEELHKLLEFLSTTLKHNSHLVSNDL